MASVIPLGRFEKVIPLTEAWPTEHGNFTPWLAANLALLGQTIEMELEFEAMERTVGAFRADILARAVGADTDHLVVIENQFGRTDHGHLGQILTYLAGIEDVKTVIWIAEKIQPDHQAAVDWLNAHTSKDFSFFAIEIELWRIDSSAPAPRFNVVSRPNEWIRPPEGPLTQAEQLRTAYWGQFSEYLKAQGSLFHIRRQVWRHWFNFPIGRSGFRIAATISIDKQRAGVEVNMRRDADKAAYNKLFAERDKIESEFGEKLDWQPLIGKQASRIAIYSHLDLADKTQWAAAQSWMLARMDKFRTVFSDRVKWLPVSTITEPQDEEPPEA